MKFATVRVPVELHLNPQDAQLLRQSFSTTQDAPDWDIVEDNTLQAGDIQVTAGASIVDAGVYTRVAAVVSQSLAADGEPD